MVNSANRYRVLKSNLAAFPLFTTSSFAGASMAKGILRLRIESITLD